MPRGCPTPFSLMLAVIVPCPLVNVTGLILTYVSCRAPPHPCRVNERREKLECDAVCHVLVHLGRCFTTLRAARGANLIMTV